MLTILNSCLNTNARSQGHRHLLARPPGIFCFAKALGLVTHFGAKAPGFPRGMVTGQIDTCKLISRSIKVYYEVKVVTMAYRMPMRSYTPALQVIQNQIHYLTTLHSLDLRGISWLWQFFCLHHWHVVHHIYIGARVHCFRARDSKNLLFSTSTVLDCIWSSIDSKSSGKTPFIANKM